MLFLDSRFFLGLFLGLLLGFFLGFFLGVFLVNFDQDLQRAVAALDNDCYVENILRAAVGAIAEIKFLASAVAIV